MIHPRIRRAPAALAAALGLAAAGWLAAPAASASPARPSPLTGGAAEHAPSPRATLAYWTAARLRSARPADLIHAGVRPSVRPATGRPAGRAARVAGGLPAGDGLAVSPQSGGGSADAFSYPFPYDSFTPPQSLWKTYPYEVNGKLFFTNDGADYVCSATSVASASGTKDENEIWTAGHCLVNTEADNQVVDSSAVFIPAYNGNKTLKKELRAVRRVHLDRRLGDLDRLVQEPRPERGRGRDDGEELIEHRQDPGSRRRLGRVRLELPGQRAVRGLRLPGGQPL